MHKLYIYNVSIDVRTADVSALLVLGVAKSVRLWFYLLIDNLYIYVCLHISSMYIHIHIMCVYVYIYKYIFLFIIVHVCRYT